MAIITVTGPLEASQLGLTLPHEHMFCDTSPDYREPPPNIRELLAALDVDLEAPITLRSLGFLRREPQWSVANQVLDSYEDARDEWAIAMRVGIRGVIDCTPIGLGRRPSALATPVPGARAGHRGCDGLLPSGVPAGGRGGHERRDARGALPAGGDRGHGSTRTCARGSSGSWARAAMPSGPTRSGCSSPRAGSSARRTCRCTCTRRVVSTWCSRRSVC